MTLPAERTRALLWAGGFLIELARDRRLPLDVRRSAVAIARHFPTYEDVADMARFRHPTGLGVGLVSPRAAGPWRADGKFGRFLASSWKPILLIYVPAIFLCGILGLAITAVDHVLTAQLCTPRWRTRSVGGRNLHART